MSILKLRWLLAALAAVALCAPATTFAEKRTSKEKSDSPTLCERAYGVRMAVIKKHGKRAPGRNICRYGVKTKRGIKDPTTRQKAVYLRALKRLNSPPPVMLAQAAGPPAQAPAGTLSSVYRPTGLAACIVHHESSGNPMAQNGQYKGIAQWSPEAWSRHGGLRFGPTPHHATYQEQLQVLSDGLARYGCRDWCPFDPC